MDRTSAPAVSTDAFNPPQPPPPQTPRADGQRAASSRFGGNGDTNAKETFESILVALILAFIFRGFVVEAFVIPTGSMAPTLLGAHVRFRCNDCGYRFDVNYSVDDRRREQETSIPTRASGKSYTAWCPNCGYRVPERIADDPENDARTPLVSYGDRILVLKYLYLFEDPQRWDVVVFKSPDPPGQYAQNYIKRLIGRPGESILILDGDIYAATAADAEIQQFQVQRKPRHVQEALWRIVYDNDYAPRGLVRANGGAWRRPWSAVDGAGWQLGGEHEQRRVFQFDNAAGGGTIEFDPTANPEQRSLTDWLAYDFESVWDLKQVNDLKLDFYYHRQDGDGPLRVRLGKRDDTFVAELLPGQARLLRVTPTGTTVLAEGAIQPTSRPIHVEFSNVDYALSLRLEGAETLRAEYAADPAALLREAQERRRPIGASIEITAERQRSQVSHLSLWRDIYYIGEDPRLGGAHDGGGPRFWASPADFPNNVIRLGADEYFVLGDNSAVSQDGRYWASPVDLPDEDLYADAGRVPGRFLLGKAFFVYWPAGFRPAPGLPAIAPNFGDMRFIH